MIAKLTVPAGMLALTAAMAMAPATANATETILFNCFHAPQYYTCAKTLPEMDRLVNEATDGRVRIRIPPKSLAGAPDQLDGVRGGVMDGAISYIGFAREETLGLQIPMLPFVGRADASAASVALWDTYQKFFAGKPGEFEDVELVAIYAINGSDIWSLTDQPIMTVKDIADRKMWAVSGTVADVIKATGSPVVAGPAVQMLEIISRGVVDGYAGVTWDTLESFKLGEYTRSGTFMTRKISQPSFALFINKDKWAKIAPEDQAAIKKALGRDYSEWFGAIVDEEFEVARDKFIAEGVKVIEPDPGLETDLAALAKPMLDEWKAATAKIGVDGDAAIAYFEDAYDKALAQEQAK